MCGIAGIVDLNQEPISPILLRAMTDSIAHRGPDGEGQWIEGNVGIGHRRLSIIDLSPSGHQPMISKGDRYVLSYNGEIYNFKEIRTTLESLGHQFRGGTDSEVVLYALAEWGPPALLRFNGMFAFALWDRITSTLLLGRDRYGVKPLYFARQSNRFYFGSEQKAIFADSRFQRELNKPALLEYFTFQNFFTDQTLDLDVHLLPAGHFGILDVRSGDWSTTQYWDFSFREPSGRVDKREYEEELSRLFRQAVNRQLVSDVEIGSYLSGGIDSGAITAVASQQIPNLKTFTVGFDLSSASGLELGFDERQQAEAFSAQFKTEHYEMVLKAGDMERCLADMVHHLEEPRVGQSYPNFYASKLASKFVKVVLSGVGGDELFGGYPWRYYRSTETQSFEDFIRVYYGYWQRLASDAELKELFAPIWGDISDVSTKDIFRAVFAKQSFDFENPADYVNASLYFEAKTFLQGLLVVEDKLSMAYGLEARVPFLDNDLVEFAMLCPASLKVKLSSSATRLDENSVSEKHRRDQMSGRVGKLIVRESLKGLLGDEVRKRRKQGFSSPDASWFRGESLDFVRRSLSNVGGAAGPGNSISKAAVDRMLDEHVTGKRNRRLLIWSLLYFSALTKLEKRGN